MKNLWQIVSGAAASLATFLMYLVGGWDAALAIMFVAMGLDYFTGLLVAFRHRSDKTEGGGFSAEVAFWGVTRKLLMLVIVAVATAVDRLIGTEGICRMAAIGFYVANDGISIIENAHAVGVSFPQGLLDVLQKIRQKNNDQAVLPGNENKDKTHTE